MRRKAALALAGAMGLALSACAQAGGGAGQNPDEPVRITISAAASLMRPFDEIAANFEAANRDIDIERIAYDGSPTLATQILEGAPVDVFASADQRNMRSVTEAGLARDPQVFATNTLVIAVPDGNPGQVRTLADLKEVTTVLCAPQVPCGSASRRLLENAGVQLQPASLEQNVSAVLQKVSAGEADAGLVYRTEVARDQTVLGIEAEGAGQVVNSYPIAAIEHDPQAVERAAAADAFVDYVLSDAGQDVLDRYGFGPVR